MSQILQASVRVLNVKFVSVQLEKDWAIMACLEGCQEKPLISVKNGVS